ncbi:MAG TPA: thioesterase family protein [Caldimonas sp.]
MASPIETYRGAVYPWHCDHMNHMNVMWYVGKFDEATWQLFSMLGLTSAWLRGNGRGMAAVEQRIAYQRELGAGATVVVRSTVLEVREKVLRFAHRMFDAETDQVAATTLLVAAHIDTERRKACALPPVVSERAQPLLGSLELPWRE